jgi:hypothetical protein
LPGVDANAAAGGDWSVEHNFAIEKNIGILKGILKRWNEG